VFDPSDVSSMDIYIKTKINHIVNNLDETNTSEDTQSHLSLYNTPSELSESPHLSPGTFINEMATRMDSCFDERREFELVDDGDEEEDVEGKLAEPQTSPYFLTRICRQRPINSNSCRFIKYGHSVPSCEAPCAVFKSATRANGVRETKAKETGSAEEVSILLPVNDLGGCNFSGSLPDLSLARKENHIALTIEDARSSDCVAKNPAHETAL
jgi:hypothetical protein